MKVRWIAIGIVLGFAVALTFGFAQGQGSPTPGPGFGGNGMMEDVGDMWATMDEMHGSPAMQEMRELMPAELRAQCEAVHRQMSETMQGMMGVAGFGGMPMDPGTHAAHHSAPAGG